MLLDTVKNYLKITWTEEDNDILEIIESGKQYLNEEIAGTELDYLLDFKAIQLLKDYCRYAYNHALESFEVNFSRELLKLSIREAVKKHEANTSDI